MTKSSDPFDELASMFLTEGDDHDECAEDGTQATTAVELLAVGHLPVRGGLWLTPYADAAARDAGPTVLLRLDGDETSLQLLRGEADALTPFLKQEPQPTITEVVGRLAPAVRNWVLRPPTGCTHAEMVMAAPDRITILSSADEAAVVAAYQLVKSLDDAARTSGCGLPAIGLAVLGADAASASSVLDRLRRTTLDCLDVDVSLVMCLTRMDAGIRSSGYMRFAGRPAPALGAVVRWIDEAEMEPEHAFEDPTGELAAETAPPQPPAPPDAPAEDEPLVVTRRQRRIIRPLRLAPKTPSQKPMPVQGQPPVRPQQRRAASQEPQAPVVQEASGHQAGPGPDAGGSGAGERERSMVDDLLAGYARAAEPQPEPLQQTGTNPAIPIPDTRPSGRIRLSPAPAMTCEPKPVVASPEPHRRGRPLELAEHVPGLTALPVRCPEHERVEIAIDSHGTMHLLSREDSIREMRVVQTWARAHRELISMACKDHRFEPAGNTICHIFTDTPITLSDLHGADLRLHVLAPVDVDGKRGWYSAPLNKPRR